jgi:hypothetical protein
MALSSGRGCSAGDEDRLEQVQLEAARIITGLPLYAPRHSLYTETSWQTLGNRRTVRDLCLMYKIQNTNVPNYLMDIFPQLVGEIQPYYLRNNQNVAAPNARLTPSVKSFVPRVTQLWNQLEITTRNLQTLPGFKYALCKSLYTYSLSPFWLRLGSRTASIYHCKLSNRSSRLNGHVFYCNLTLWCRDPYAIRVKIPNQGGRSPYVVRVNIFCVFLCEITVLPSLNCGYN